VLHAWCWRKMRIHGVGGRCASSANADCGTLADAQRKVVQHLCTILHVEFTLQELYAQH